MTLGFLFYGRRLISLLPNMLHKKMKKVQLTTTACSILFIVISLHSIAKVSLTCHELALNVGVINATPSAIVGIHYMFDTVVFAIEVVLLSSCIL
jgi:hypothetical protein